MISNKVKRGIQSKAAAISSPHLCPLNMLLRALRADRVMVRAERVEVRAVRVRVRNVGVRVRVRVT